MQTFFIKTSKRIRARVSFLVPIFIFVLNSCHTPLQKFSLEEKTLPLFCAERLEEAKQYVWERHYYDALQILENSGNLCANSSELELLRGEIYHTLDRWDEAGKEFESVLTKSPKNWRATVFLWYIDAVCRGFDDKSRQGLKKRALEYLNKDPNNPEVIYTVILGLEGAKALQEKTSVIEKYGHTIDNEDWRSEMAELYFYDTLRTRGDERLKRARFFRKAFPKSRMRYNMAEIALSILNNNGPEAVQMEAEKILHKQPENRILNYLCSKAIVETKGDLSLAEKYIKIAIKAAENLDPTDRYAFVDDESWDKLMCKTRSEYFALYGRILFLQGDIPEALESFNQGLNLDNRNVNLSLWYAEALKAGNHMNEALTQFRKAAELSGLKASVDGIRSILELRGIHTDPAEYFAGSEKIPRLTNVTETSGLQGCSGMRVSWSDLNIDGFPDLIVGGSSILLNNRDGSFKNVTESSGVRHADASGCILADFNKDGLPDMLVFTSNSGPRLYFNNSEKESSIRMKDVTEAALPFWPFDDAPTEAAAAADVDNDGSVDIYLANYEINGPERSRCAPDMFYLNQGNGTFTDATSKIKYSSEESMCGRGVSFSDFNGDGRVDLFVANYRLDPDFLLVNMVGNEDPEIIFFDKAQALGVRGDNRLGAYGHSIGPAWGYLTKDRPALFVASLAHPRYLGLSDISALYLPEDGGEGFESHFEDMGLAYHETHSDSSFVDFDLDGDLDLYITSIYSGSPSFLYLNQDGGFIDSTWLSGARVYNGWGSAWADYDRDGDMDLAVCSGNMVNLLRNESHQYRRSWLEVKLEGTKSPTSGIGAKVTVQDSQTNELWTREIRAGRGTGNQDEALAHFGLGKNKGPFSVTVAFPSGIKVVLQDVGCCKLIEVLEPDL